MRKILAFMLIATLLLACEKKQQPIFEEKPLVLNAVQKIRVAQDNDFAFELMKQTLAEYSDKSNIFISPLSVSMALGMTRNGAINDTKTEMDAALKLRGMSDAEINEYYKLMQNSLPLVDSKTKFILANSIWYRNSFQVKPEFLKTNVDYFNSKVAALDFDDPKSVDIINNWCSDKTNGLIPQVLNRISSEQMMFLINAIYFKGAWVTKFDKKKTSEREFTNELGEKSKVNMMHLTDTFAYSEDNFAQYLDMPYGNKSFSMTVILPKGNNQAKNVFETLSTGQLNESISKQRMEKVNLYFPRFNVKNSLDLVPVLQSMGMNKAFTTSAELDNIAVMKPLYIDMVKHDSYVEVTEEGTEAAAVTTVGVGATSVPIIQDFIVNKPFAFVIREKNSGIILFVGKIGNVKKF